MAQISIIIPVYNVACFIAETLESVKAQTFADFQAIVVDDGSSDDTASIAREICATDPRFVFAANPENRGIADTLNHALSLADGQFIARADGDDVMIPDRLEREMAFLAAHPEIALVGASFIAIDEEGNELRREVKAHGPKTIRDLLRFTSPIAHIWLARRAVYDALGGYRMSSVEDYDFLLRADRAGLAMDNIADYFSMKVRVRRGNTLTTKGYAQARLREYAWHLYKNAQPGEPDAYDQEKVEAILADDGSSLMARMHNHSSRLAMAASGSQNRWARLVLYAGAAGLSPYRARYFVRRFLEKSGLR